MADLTAPKQSYLLGQLANMLRGREELQTQMNPTMMGALMDLILPSSQFVEKLSYGDPMFRMPPSGTGGYIPITADKQYAAEAASYLPGVAPAARATTQISNQAADALVRAITRNPQATATRTIQETSMPFMQAVAPKSEGLLDVSYRGVHSAPNRDFGAPLHALNQIYPDDVYSKDAARLYGHFGGGDAMDRQTVRIAQSFRNKPDAEVIIYRAVPKDDTIKEINPGDWVTINKDYAKQHGDSVLRGEYKIVEKKVPAKDIWTNADSIHEYGYSPE